MPLPTIPSGNVNSGLATGFDVANSIRYNDGDSPKLNINFGSDGTLNKWTFSMWFKRSTLGTAQRLFCVIDSGMDDYIKFGTDDQLEWVFDNEDGSNKGVLKTNRKFRDVSAWYHLVCRLDTTQSTAGDRMRMYINGTEETSFATDTNPTLNETGDIGRDNNHYIGTSGSSQYFDGYIAEVCMINNQSLAPTSFGEFDSDTPSVFKPIDVSGLTAGTNGFYLDFEDSSNLGNDAFGGTDWTETNLAATDQATDTPTNNFATFNVLSKNDSGTVTFSEGNLFTAHSGSDSKFCSYSTIGVTSGKWYGEFKFAASSGGTDYEVGVGYDVEDANRLGKEFGYTAGTYGYNAYGNKHNDSNESSYGDTLAVGDIVGIALDLDNHKLYFSKNGTWQASGDPESGATGTNAAFSLTTGETYFMGASHATATSRTTDYAGNYGGCPAFTISSGNADANGYGAFEYAPPSGYYALCTKNLAEYG